MFASFIALLLSNFGLVMLVLAVIFSLLNSMSLSANHSQSSYEIFFKWVTLLPLGFTLIYVFIMHAFFSNFTASLIGWQASPFQYEVAMADLSLGVLAILAFNASYEFRLASVIGSTIWLWGDAIGHIYQMMTNSNFTIGNAGSWFWLDILIPLILIVCLSKIKVKRFF